MQTTAETKIALNEFPVNTPGLPHCKQFSLFSTRKVAHTVALALYLMVLSLAWVKEQVHMLFVFLIRLSLI